MQKVRDHLDCSLLPSAHRQPHRRRRPSRCVRIPQAKQRLCARHLRYVNVISGRLEARGQLAPRHLGVVAKNNSPTFREPLHKQEPSPTLCIICRINNLRQSAQIRIANFDAETTTVHRDSQTCRSARPNMCNDVRHEFRHTELRLVSQLRQPPKSQVQPHDTAEAGKLRGLCQEGQLPALPGDPEVTRTHDNHHFHTLAITPCVLSTTAWQWNSQNGTLKGTVWRHPGRRTPPAYAALPPSPRSLQSLGI
ncbi:hypothetical protein BCL80_101160 [Streptomyces avidinii]|nr:hypothetical protein BCL80_101160 [Streptomyces avidinii]SNX71883.1 hypothetical protein SAMN05421860_101160 [Streptomyces microflavus]